MANLDTHLLNVRNDEVHDSEISLDGFAHVGAPHLDDDFSTVTFKCSTIDNTDGGRADGRFIYGGKDLVAFFTQRLIFFSLNIFQPVNFSMGTLINGDMEIPNPRNGADSFSVASSNGMPFT